MPVEITGLVSHNTGAPLAPCPQSEFDVEAIVASAVAQEAAGYDRVLIANNAVAPDCHTIGTYVAANTTRLKLMLAHRPGFIAPTMGARMLATVDRLSKGRAGVHIIAGPSDKELEADGDFISKDDRYARAREYVEIMRRIWTSDAPIDHEGRFYRFNQAFAAIKPTAPLPVFWAGTSDTSLDACGASADVYAMSGDSVASLTPLVAKAGAAAARHGRKLDYMATLLVIIGATETEAWAKADQALDGFYALQARRAAEQGPSTFGAPSAALDRILSSAAAGTRQEKCLWTGMTQAAQGKFGNQTTLVGTPEQVVDGLMDYYKLGFSRFLIRGYHPEQDVPDYGRELFPRLRAATQAYDLSRAELQSA